MKIQRLVAAGAMVALAVSMSACGGAEPPSSPPLATTAPPSTAGGDGVTTPADTFGPACAQLPQGRAPGSLDSMGPQPVASAAGTNPLLTTLVTGVKSVGLVETLNQQRAITVFAPYNPAFDEFKGSVGDQQYGALLANKDALGGVLKYHVIAKRYDKDGLLAEPKGAIATLGGGTVTVKADGDSLTVTDGAGQTANVLCGNIPTANATVFVIDKVLQAKQP